MSTGKEATSTRGQVRTELTPGFLPAFQRFLEQPGVPQPATGAQRTVSDP